MGFIVGALVGLGCLIVIRAWQDPHPFHLPPQALPPLVGAALGAAGTVLIIPSVVFMGCGAVVGAVITYLVRYSRQQKHATRQREAWPDVLDDVVGSLRAGLSISQSLVVVSQRGPELMREPFARCAQRIRAHGRLDSALNDLKDEFHDPMADRVIEAMRLSHELGGHDLAKMLSQLASLVREDNRARGELLARQSWTVNGARLAAGAPWILLALFATRPGTVEAFSTAGGIGVLVGGAFLTVLAYGVMIKLGELTPDMRIFVSSPPRIGGN